MTQIFNIIAEDGCFYQDEFSLNLSHKQVVEKILNSACKPIREILDNNYNPIYRRRYTVKLSNGTYAMCNMENPYKYLELAIQRLGELEDEKEND